MRESFETQEGPKRAFLVGIWDERITQQEADSLAAELLGLAKTLGLEIVGKEMVHIRERQPKFGMGTGKAAELAEKAAAVKADCLIFDKELSPSQQRNWETLSGISALDRQELIIQIFADRAQTKEAMLQVELAELSYTLPRLRHKYIDLSRQRGGRYGTKGSGETRLETDRRLVENRIHRLEQELADVRKNRAVQRKKRERQGIPTCALIGYTNAGKSSLLNVLTNADAFVEDKLFATLDATTRQLDTAKGQSLLLTDTVGFIRHLPHALVQAFHSTLEEVTLADLLMHVLDASDPDIDRYFETTLQVLRELGADHIPMITVLNKSDCLEGPEIRESLQKRYTDGMFVSAKTGSGLEELIHYIEDFVSSEITRFRFPADRYDLAGLLHRSGNVLSEKYGESVIEMEAQVGTQSLEMLRQFVVKV